MKRKILLIFIVVSLFMTLNAFEIDKNDDKVSFHSSDGNETGYSTNWKNKIGMFHNGITDVVNKLCGPVFHIGNKLLELYTDFQKSLEAIISCNSIILSTNSSGILETISLLSNLGVSPGKAITEMNKILGIFICSLTKIVSTLSENIGKLTILINEAITDLEFALGTVYSTVEHSGILRIGLREKLNFRPVWKAVHRLVNTITVIAKTILNATESILSIIEALAVLAFVLNLLLMVVLGSHICIAAILHTSFQGIPNTLNKFLQALDDTIEGITGSIRGLTSGLTENISMNKLQIILTNLNNVSSSLNDALKENVDDFDDVTISVEHIIQCLPKSLSLKFYDETTELRSSWWCDCSKE